MRSQGPGVPKLLDMQSQLGLRELGMELDQWVEEPGNGRGWEDGELQLSSAFSMLPHNGLFGFCFCFMKETVLGSKLFIGCSLWKLDAYHLLKVDLRLNTFCRKECPGREAYWLNPQGL